MASENIQLKWLKETDPKDQQYVSMVVGWQTVVETLNSTVLRFNSKYLQESDSLHHEMKIIAAKQSVMASLRELRLRLETWRNNLAKLNALSDESKALWKKLHPTLEKIHQFKDIRNCAFHFGDFVDPPGDMIALYEDVLAFDIDELNAMLRALYDFGNQLRSDAMTALGH